jgi:hypothetical protein
VCTPAPTLSLASSVGWATRSVVAAGRQGRKRPGARHRYWKVTIAAPGQRRWPSWSRCQHQNLTATPDAFHTRRTKGHIQSKRGAGRADHERAHAHRQPRERSVLHRGELGPGRSGNVLDLKRDLARGRRSVRRARHRASTSSQPVSGRVGRYVVWMICGATFESTAIRLFAPFALESFDIRLSDWSRASKKGGPMLPTASSAVVWASTGAVPLRWSTSKRPSARGPPRTAAGKSSARHHGERSHGLALPNQATCGREGNPPDRGVCPRLASHSPPNWLNLPDT